MVTTIVSVVISLLALAVNLAAARRMMKTRALLQRERAMIDRERAMIDREHTAVMELKGTLDRLREHLELKQSINNLLADQIETCFRWALPRERRPS